MIKIVFTEKKNKNKKKKRSISKFLIFIMTLMTILVFGFTIYMTWVTHDLTPLTVIIPCVFAEMSVVSAFYMWKSKALSIIELKKEYGEKFIEDTLDDIN